MSRRFVVFLLPLLLVACHSSPPVKPVVDAPATLSSAQQEVAPERFVLRRLPPLLQPYGYHGFCSGIVRCESALPYDQYVGMGGVFESAQPLKQLPEWDIYRLRLDNGERYFFFAHRELGGKFSAVSPLIPEAVHKTVVGFRPQPLVACSGVWLADLALDFSGVRYRLNDGRNMSAAQLGLIREVAAAVGGHQAQIAERLIDLEIQAEREDGNQVYVIRPLGELVANDLRLYIRLTDAGPQLFFRALYVGEQRLGVRTIEFSADEQHWTMNGLRLASRNYNGQMREWLDTPASPLQLVVARRLAKAKHARLRFTGPDYYDDVVLTALQKDDLGRVLALFDLLRESQDQSAVLACPDDGASGAAALE